jgi:hypothetical protein
LYANERKSLVAIISLLSLFVVSAELTIIGMWVRLADVLWVINGVH